MPRKRSIPIRPLWEERFRAPTLPALLAALDEPRAELFAHARDGLLALPGVRESLGWQGIPWRWCLSFTNGHPKPLAYLVPQPTKPHLIMRFPEDVADLFDRKSSKPIRDVVEHSPVIVGTRWTQWDLNSRTQIDELLQLAARVQQPRLASPAAQPA